MAKDAASVAMTMLVYVAFTFTVPVAPVGVVVAEAVDAGDVAFGMVARAGGVTARRAVAGHKINSI